MFVGLFVICSGVGIVGIVACSLLCVCLFVVGGGVLSVASSSPCCSCWVRVVVVEVDCGLSLTSLFVDPS